MTGLDLITSALRANGAVASGESPTGDEANDGLVVLNQMLKSFNNEGLMLYAVTRQTPFAVVGQTVTVGSSGDIAIARPTRIERVGAECGGYEYDVTPLTAAQWATVGDKDLSADPITHYWDDGGFPLRTLTIYPVPASAQNLVLYTWGLLTAFTLAADNAFPDGYDEMLKYNLAVRLAAEGFGNLTPAAAGLAMETKANVKRAHVTNPEIRCDRSMLSNSNMDALYLPNINSGIL